MTPADPFSAVGGFQPNDVNDAESGPPHAKELAPSVGSVVFPMVCTDPACVPSEVDETVVPLTAPVLANEEGVIAPSVNVMAGVVVAVDPRLKLRRSEEQQSEL